MTIRKTRVRALRAVLGAFIVLAFFIGQSRLHSSWAEYAFRWSGYTLLLAGLGLRLWSTLYIADHKSKILVTLGPYSLCRNPLYLGTSLVALGAALSFENIPLCIYTVAVVVPVHLLVVKMEEAHLLDLFGDEYRQYCRTTSRFMPSLAGFQQEAELRIESRSLNRAAIDALGVLLLPPLGHLSGLLQQAHLLPVLWKV